MATLIYSDLHLFGFAIYYPCGFYIHTKPCAGRYAIAYAAWNEKLELGKVILENKISSPFSHHHYQLIQCNAALLCVEQFVSHTQSTTSRGLWIRQRSFVSASNSVCDDRSTISRSRCNNARDGAQGHNWACAEAQRLVQAGAMGCIYLVKSFWTDATFISLLSTCKKQSL